MTRITVAGEALVDFVRDENGALQWTPGGSGLNTALALARLGIETSFAGSLSCDDNGHKLSNFMRNEGIDLSQTWASNKPCPHVLASKDAQGVPTYDLHLAGSALEEAPLQWGWLHDTSHFHATSFAATLGPGGASALAALQQARSSISTSFDPNIRASVFPDRSAIPLLLAHRIKHADIVKVSSEDLDVIAPGILHDHIIDEWTALGVRLVIVTRGAKGAVAWFEHQQFEVATPRVDVCDTIGAGDTFMGALLAIMSDDNALGHKRDGWSSEQVRHWLSFAAHAASLCCARPGADPPTREKLRAQR